MRQQPVDGMACDAAVIGGGLSGLAASIQLAKAGSSVYCFEPVSNFEQIVGESLDWSSPALLRQVGFSMEKLVRTETSTYKRRVILNLLDGAEREYIPPPKLEQPPLNIELRTIHVDRLRLQHLAVPESFARRASSLIPNSELIQIDCGHFIPLNRPTSVASRLAQFFGSE